MKNFLFLFIFFLSVPFAQVFGQGSGHALRFDGNDHVDIGNAAVLSFENTDPFTVECWIKTASSGATVYSKLSSVLAPNNGYEIRVDATGRVRALLINHWSAGDAIYCRGTTIVNDNKWHHIAYTYDGSLGAAGVRMYVDGVLQMHTILLGMNSLNASGTMISSSGAALGSRAGGGSNRYNGRIDETRVWNRVLTEAEIRTNMCKKLTGSEAGLVAYYRMDEGADNTCSGGEDVCDLTGNNNHGVKF